MRQALFASIFSLTLFSLTGGCLILAQDGFTTSSKRGHWSIFVPTPAAYVMAAIMLALSMLGMLWMLQQARASRTLYALGAVVYGCAAYAITKTLAIYLQ